MALWTTSLLRGRRRSKVGISYTKCNIWNLGQQYLEKCMKAIYLPQYQWYFYFLLLFVWYFSKNFSECIITDNTDCNTNGVIFFGFMYCEWGKSLLRVSPWNIFIQITLHTNTTFAAISFICCVIATSICYSNEVYTVPINRCWGSPT